MIYHIIFENEHKMMESSEDQNYFCVYFVPESISIVNNICTCLLQTPNEKF